MVNVVAKQPARHVHKTQRRCDGLSSARVRSRCQAGSVAGRSERGWGVWCDSGTPSAGEWASEEAPEEAPEEAS
ncbi:hypothetical protein N8077_03505 [Myxococcota bacterium]|nr:hypothetical protein [Myxococcota bacterium]